MSDRFGSCKFNQMITCTAKGKCTTCGWNPAVRKTRIKEYRKLRAAGLKDMPSRCPFCNAVPAFEMNDCGVIIRCNNPRCKVASTGYRSSVARASAMWELRNGVRKADAT